jgi:small subunit ribosomal protein S15
MANTLEAKKPTWLKYTKSEVEAIILKLANKNLTAEKIGLTLRDQYGIPSVKLYNITIKDIMKDRFKEPTILNLETKLQNIINHFKKNNQDKKTGRALIITKAKLKKRTIQYRKTFKKKVDFSFPNRGENVRKYKSIYKYIS